MRQAVLAEFPAGTAVSNPTGGCFIWVQAPESVDARELHRMALAQGVSIAPGPVFCPHRRYGNYLRLNCGVVWSPRIAAAIGVLGGLARQLARRQLRTA